MDHSLEETQHSQGKYRCLYRRIIYFRVDVRLMHKRIGSLATEGRARAPKWRRGRSAVMAKGRKSHFNFRGRQQPANFLEKLGGLVRSIYVQVPRPPFLLKLLLDRVLGLF